MLSARPWRAEAILQFWGVLLLCWCLGMVVNGLLHQAGINGFGRPDDFGPVLIATLSLQGVAWVLILIFLRQHQVNWRDAFGLRGSRWGRALFLALPVTVIILFLAWGLQDLSVSVLKRFGYQPEDQLAVALLEGARTWWMRAYLGVFAVVLAPVAEEFIFRGMLYPAVKQLGAPGLAFFGVNALFALIHLDVATLLPLFVLGLVLTWLYEKTDNLLAPVAAHALFNAANLGLLLSLPNRAP